MTNLILNSNFTQHTQLPGSHHGQIFDNWSQDNNFWMHSPKPVAACENSSAKMGQDEPQPGTIYGWLIGDADRLWQEVDALTPHTQVTLSTVEIQHMYEGRAELRLYGWNGVSWELIFERLAPDYPINTPATRSVWYPRAYVISPSTHTRYKVEMTGELCNPDDGWKFTCISVEVS